MNNWINALNKEAAKASEEYEDLHKKWLEINHQASLVSRELDLLNKLLEFLEEKPIDYCV